MHHSSDILKQETEMSQQDRMYLDFLEYDESLDWNNSQQESQNEIVQAHARNHFQQTKQPISYSPIHRSTSSTTFESSFSKTLMDESKENSFSVLVSLMEKLVNQEEETANQQVVGTEQNTCEESRQGSVSFSNIHETSLVREEDETLQPHRRVKRRFFKK